MLPPDRSLLAITILYDARTFLSPSHKATESDHYGLTKPIKPIIYNINDLFSLYQKNLLAKGNNDSHTETPTKTGSPQNASTVPLAGRAVFCGVGAPKRTDVEKASATT